MKNKINIGYFIESATYGFIFTSWKTLENEQVSTANEWVFHFFVFQNFATSEWKSIQSTFYAVICLLYMLQVNLFQPRSIWFFFLLLRQTKKYFWHLRAALHPPSSLHLHSTYLTYYSLPALPTSQPVFFLSQCLPWKPWTTNLWFSFGFMSWCLTIEPCRLGCKFHYFFNYIYIVVVINFLKLFKSDILIKENIPPIITLQYMYLCPNYIQINLTVISN